MTHLILLSSLYERLKHTHTHTHAHAHAQISTVFQLLLLSSPTVFCTSEGCMNWTPNGSETGRPQSSSYTTRIAKYRREWSTIDLLQSSALWRQDK